MPLCPPPPQSAATGPFVDNIMTAGGGEVTYVSTKPLKGGCLMGESIFSWTISKITSTSKL